MCTNSAIMQEPVCLSCKWDTLLPEVGEGGGGQDKSVWVGENV